MSRNENEAERPLAPPSRAGADPGGTCKRFAPRRTPFELSKAIEIDGQRISSIHLRAADIDDAMALPVQRICGCHPHLIARWVARLSGIPEPSASQIAHADLDALAHTINGPLDSIREALNPFGPREFGLDLEKPITRADGTVLARLPLRCPLLSDYELLHWQGSLDTHWRVARGIETAPDRNLAARWAVKLSGVVELEDIRRLRPRDGGMVLAEVAALVCGFEVFVIANS